MQLSRIILDILVQNTNFYYGQGNLAQSIFRVSPMVAITYADIECFIVVVKEMVLLGGVNAPWKPIVDG